MEEMLSPRLARLSSDDAGDASDARSGVRAPRAERSVLDWLRGNSHQGSSQTQPNRRTVPQAADQGGIVTDEGQNSQDDSSMKNEKDAPDLGGCAKRMSPLCARVLSPPFGTGHTAPARCLSGATALSAVHVRPAKQACKGQTKTDLRTEQPATTEGKRETRRPLGRLARASPLRGEGVERLWSNSTIRKTSKKFYAVPPTKPSPHVQLGQRLLSRMLASLLKHKALVDALEFAPNIKLGGEANFLFRSKLRFARKMLRAWLWVQSLERLSALPTPKKRTKGPRVRPHTKPEAGPFSPQGLTVFRRDMPQQDDLSRRLRAQGFRPRVGIWRQKSTVCSCAAPSLRYGAHCACAGLVGGTSTKEGQNGQDDNSMKKETDAPDLGWQAKRASRGEVVARPRCRGDREPMIGLSKQSNAPRAGQIYVDLRYMQALISAPDRAIARLARRMRAKKSIFSFKDKRPLKPPQPPNQNWRTRLTLPPSQEEWWRGFVEPPTEDNQPKVPP